nr:unnamed protein product [Leishmania braziliensis]
MRRKSGYSEAAHLSAVSDDRSAPSNSATGKNVGLSDAVEPHEFGNKSMSVSGQRRVDGEDSLNSDSRQPRSWRAAERTALPTPAILAHSAAADAKYRARRSMRCHVLEPITLPPLLPSWRPWRGRGFCCLAAAPQVSGTR